MGYVHLNIDEREVILKMLAQNASMQRIADSLGRSKGTISRELCRNTSSGGDYKPHLAQRYYQNRRLESKEPYRIESDRWLRNYVMAGLKRYWSPEQISGKLRKGHSIDISHVTIYGWVYREIADGGKLAKYLRQGHLRRRKRRCGRDNRGQIPGRRMIDKRPKIVNERKRIGDWEGDTLEGRKGSSLFATYVERKSRYTEAVKVIRKSAEILNFMTIDTMKKLPSKKVRTITFDNGREFAGFKELEQELGMRSYFAQPYHSWERGTSENTNGLLRQFFPKGMDFDDVSQSELDKVTELLNNRPRKCLNYRTPNEVFWGKTKRCASD